MTSLTLTNRNPHNPWLWIPSLSVAEEIASTVVLYVALLMFWQFGSSQVLASVYSALLFLPWVFKSYLYSKVRKAGRFKRHLHVVESLMFLCLMGLALYLAELQVCVHILFLFLFVLSLLCAWHELLSRLYYSTMLHPQQQRYFRNLKLLPAQSAQVVTYGVLIIVVGFFEVFFRSYQKAWAMESSLVAGVFFFFLVLNVIVLQNPSQAHPSRHETIAAAVKSELHVLSRLQQKPHTLPDILSLFFLLLPHALLFNPRVFFLLNSADQGGLGCSVQEVGFAQGTIGVLAFSLGYLMGRWAMERWGWQRMFVPIAVVLTLSPVSYCLMALSPTGDNMWLLCCMTFSAQWCFGFGLNVCRLYVPFVSASRYRHVANPLYVPLVASLVILPMALSGWLFTLLGAPTYFMLCVAMAPIAWLTLSLCKRFILVY